jgi:hypothetical protein
MPWWAHWYVMIPGVLALWGLGVAIARSNRERYLEKLERGEVKPPAPLPTRCFDHQPVYLADRSYPCPNCGRR